MLDEMRQLNKGESSDPLLTRAVVVMYVGCYLLAYMTNQSGVTGMLVTYSICLPSGKTSQCESSCTYNRLSTLSGVSPPQGFL